MIQPNKNIGNQLVNFMSKNNIKKTNRIFIFLILVSRLKSSPCVTKLRAALPTRSNPCPNRRNKPHPKIQANTTETEGNWMEYYPVVGERGILDLAIPLRAAGSVMIVGA